MASVKAWLFDLGNTLMSIPLEHDEEECIQRILGYEDCDQVRSIIYRICDGYPGQSIEEFLNRFDVEVNPARSENLASAIREAWMNSVRQAILKPHANQVLDELRAAGVKLALVSNTPPTSHYILDSLGLRSRFDEVVFSCDVGFLKPDPRIFKVAMDRLGVRADACVLVGDKIRTDILGGAILGMRCVLVEERLRTVVESGQNYVDAIVPNLESLRTTSCFRETIHA